MKNRFRLPTLGLAAAALPFVLLAGCASSGSQGLTVDNALLAELSDEARAPIAEARTARDRATDSLAAAAKELKNAPERVKMGKATLDSEESALAKATLAAEYARGSGTPEDVAAADLDVEHKTATVKAAEMGVELAKSELSLAKASHALAEKESLLAEAKVELAKARAVQHLDLASTREINVDDFLKRMEKASAAVEKAGGEVTEKKSKIGNMRREVEALQNQAREIEPPR